MTVASAPSITRKLASQPTQEDRFRALDRALARRYVSHILREQNTALERRVRQGSLVYKPRYAGSPTTHLPSSLMYFTGLNYATTHLRLA